MPATRETFAGRYRSTHTAPQVIRRADPVLADGIGTEQSSGDLAGVGAVSAAVECAQRRDPAVRAAFRRKKRAREPSQASQSDQSVQRRQLGLDTVKADEVVAQPNRAFEQAPMPNLELEAVNAVAEQKMLGTVTGPQDRHNAAEAPQVEAVSVAPGDRMRLDNEHGFVDIGAPEDSSGAGWAIRFFAESATPKLAPCR